MEKVIGGHLAGDRYRFFLGGPARRRSDCCFFGALLSHGIPPSPCLLSERPDLFWGVVCSMYIGNAMLLILNLPLIWIWVQVLRVPYKYLFPVILLFCLIGAYSLSNNIFDIFSMFFFGVLCD